MGKRRELPPSPTLLCQLADSEWHSKASNGRGKLANTILLIADACATQTAESLLNLVNMKDLKVIALLFAAIIGVGVLFRYLNTNPPPSRTVQTGTLPLPQDEIEEFFGQLATVTGLDFGNLKESRFDWPGTEDGVTGKQVTLASASEEDFRKTEAFFSEQGFGPRSVAEGRTDYLKEGLVCRLQKTATDGADKLTVDCGKLIASPDSPLR